MRHVEHALAVVLTLGMLLTACAEVKGEDETHTDPATIEKIAGTGVSQLTLEAPAAERIGLATVPIAEKAVGRTTRRVIPYSAILYDSAGNTWAYVRTAKLTYVRQRITVEDIQGDEALLSAGPPVGTDVVAVGVAELYGTEVGVGK